MSIKITEIGSAVPNELWSNSRIADLTGADIGFIESKVGVESRYFLAEDETALMLAKQAVDNLKAKLECDKLNVDLLVFVTQTPDHRLPHMSALLQADLEIKDCAAFDISLGCSGYVYALSIVKGMMLVQGFENALLVTCDPYSKIMNASDKNTMTVFGDAATATLISNEEGQGFEIGLADMGTNGDYASSLIIKDCGGANPVLGIHNKTTKKDFETESAALYMNGREVFNFVLKNVPMSIANCLSKNDSVDEDVSWYALHQGSKHMLDYMCSRGGVPDAKVLRNISQYGNTVSSTVPMLLESLMTQSSIRAGEKVIISGFGVGLSWATNLLTYTNRS